MFKKTTRLNYSEVILVNRHISSGILRITAIYPCQNTFNKGTIHGAWLTETLNIVIFKWRQRFSGFI